MLTIYTILICWLRFSSEWVMTLLTDDNNVTQLIIFLGGNCDLQFTILKFRACGEKADDLLPKYALSISF